jgi:hypothetical protein
MSAGTAALPSGARRSTPKTPTRIRANWEDADPPPAFAVDMIID